MTAETDLLPLPEKSEIDRHLPTGVRVYGYTADDMKTYASACVSSATAEKDAEIDALRTRLEDTVRDSTNKIEALRAEVATWEGLHASEVQARQRWQARAELLAEALRLALNSHGKTLLTDPPQDAWKVNRVEEIGRALLRDQEEGQ